MKLLKLLSNSCAVVLLLISLRYSVIAQQSLPLSPELRVTEAAQIEIDDEFFNLAWNPVNSSLAISGLKGVYLYDADFLPIATLQFEENPVTISTIWSPDGRIAASLLGSNNVYFWDANTRAVLDVWHAGTLMPSSIAWSPDGSKVARSSIDGTVKIYDVGERREIYSSQPFEYGPNPKSLVWNADSRHLLFIGQDVTIRGVFIFDTVTNNVVDSIASEAKAARWNPAGNLLAFGDYILQVNRYVKSLPDFGIITIWENDPELIFRNGMLTYATTNALAWNPSGRYLASYSGEYQIQIWDVGNGQLVAQMPGGRPNFDDIASFDWLAWSPNGHQLAAVGRDVVYIWNISES